MIRVIFSICAGFALIGCADAPFGLGKLSKARPATSVSAETEVTAADTKPEVAEAPPADAMTVEEFDTTSNEDRVAAVVEAKKADAVRDLGTTIASLGSPADPGIWLKTSLVSAPGKGRVDYPAKGTSVVVDLIPIEGGQGAGSRMSLAAMRLIEADLTSLPEVRVFQIRD